MADRPAAVMLSSPQGVFCWFNINSVSISNFMGLIIIIDHILSTTCQLFEVVSKCSGTLIESEPYS